MSIEQNKMSRADAIDIEALEKRIHQKQHRKEYEPPDMEKVEGMPPTIAVKWGRNDKKQIARLKSEGWEIAKYSDRVKAGYERDGVHENGDRILMVMPKELRDSRMKAIHEMTKMREQNTRMDFSEELNRHGMKIIESGNVRKSDDPRSEKE